VLKKIFGQMAADKARDACDQCPQVAPLSPVTHSHYSLLDGAVFNLWCSIIPHFVYHRKDTPKVRCYCNFTHLPAGYPCGIIGAGTHFND